MAILSMALDHLETTWTEWSSFHMRSYTLWSCFEVGLLETDCCSGGKSEVDENGKRALKIDQLFTDVKVKSLINNFHKNIPLAIILGTLQLLVLISRYI